MMKLSEINACIIIPTYNNANTLARVIEGVLNFSEGNDVILINDGSTDSTSSILEKFQDRLIILTHAPNVGKGYSLRKGFKEATLRGFQNAITIDSDGQHFPDDISQFIAAGKENPGALLMGSRNMEQAGVPGKSSFGNKFSNFWFWVETGITLPDTQTGFRLYPLDTLKQIKLFTKKFETEIEVIVKLAWRDVKCVSVPVKVLYDKDERVSHFRPFQDFTRISILNTYFVILTLIFYLPKRMIGNIYRKGWWNIIREETIKPGETNFKKASSIGFGIFMGIVPIWGFQLLVGIPLAILFRMNKVLFIASANISIPPMIPLIIFLSYCMGGLFIENNIHFQSISAITLKDIHLNLLQYVIGAVALAIFAGGFFFGLFYLLFSSRRKNIISS